MRKKVCVGLLTLALIAVSVAAHGGLLRLTTGTSAAFVLWQSSPPVFGTETFWGGVGIDLLYRSFTLSAAVTLADLKTFRIEENPHFSYGATLTFLRVGSVGVFLGVGAVANPLWSPYAVSVGPGVSWSPFRYTSISVSVGYETTIRGATGSCIYISLGVSAHIPLL